MATIRNLPVEVQLILEVMPCQAMRRTFDSVETPHPCTYFTEWGHYHSYDYPKHGAPANPGILQPAVYAGKRAPIPETLSGCRKAPIMCVGINPNLPGFRDQDHHSVHPYFEDYLQYAHYFRYRSTAKLAMPRAEYEQKLAGRTDGPAIKRPLVSLKDPINLQPNPVTMYLQYQKVLDGLAAAEGWAGHHLAVGEDLCYANMVACASAAWVVEPRPQNPEYPAMGTERATGIVNECFHSRQYFLRQMIQTLPAVVIVLSKTTTRPFIRAMGANFIGQAPDPDDDWDALLAQDIRIRLLTLPSGEVLSARVLFVPHASSSQADFNARLGKIIGILREEVAAGRLKFNAATGHFSRARGACQFCTNSLYQIGKCDYESELSSLAAGPGAPGVLDAGDGAPAPQEKVRAENAFHARALSSFLTHAAVAPAVAPMAAAATPVGGGIGVIQPLDVDPLTSKPLVLRGKVVTMAGSVIDKGAVYLRNGKIAAVIEANDPAPPGFQTAPVVETNGVIYPGLIDLHNHLAFNMIQLWDAPKKFKNRGEWRKRTDYRRNVYNPADLLTKKPASAPAVARYVEVKLLVGGVTTSQGYGRNKKDYRGIVRNFEYADDVANLPDVANELFDLRHTTASADEFRALLGQHQAVMHHLAEGVDDFSANLFTFLKDNDLVKSSLVAIHALGLRAEDFPVLANASAKVVWSPLSNCLLYGQTLKVVNLTAAGVTFGLGCDWCPSGSKNLLQEMKVARLAAANDGTPISDEALCKAVTVNGAKVAAWHRALGTIEKDKYADVVVLSKRQADVYRNMVEATEADVRLVIVAGVPRYGEQALMTATQLPAADLEAITVAGRACALYLRHPLSPIGSLAFAKAKQTLETAMADLPGWAANSVADGFAPQSAGETPFTIALDMDHDEWMDELAPSAPGVTGVLDTEPALPTSVPLDPLTIIDDPSYFTRFEKIAPGFLHALKNFYPH